MTLRVGIVGAGYMGSVHAAAWHALGVRPVGVHSRRVGSANRLARAIGARSYRTMEALIDSVDIVDICAPTRTHAALALPALASGRHVICEKPIALTLDDALAMAAAAAASDARLFIGHVVRYYPEYEAAKSAVDSGMIGEPSVIRLSREANRPTTRERSWLLDRAESGGILVDFMIHDYDFARWIAGEVRSVFALLVDVGGSQMSDCAIVTLSHVGGAISHVVGSWAQPSAGFRTGFDIAGSHGSLVHDSYRHRALTIDRHQQSVAVGLPSSPMAETPHVSELRDFMQAIENGEAPRIDVADGIAALRIALAATQSLQSGRAVNL